MLGVEANIFFFEQQKKKRLHRRRTRLLYDDNHSLFGGESRRSEGISFRPGEKDWDVNSVVGGRAPSYRSTGSRPRPGSASRRISVHEAIPIVLPSIDPHWPNLVSHHQIPEEPAGKFSDNNNNNNSNNKPEFSRDRFIFEDKSPLKNTPHKVGSLWKLDEAKFASTGILSQLSKVLTKVVASNVDVTIPVDLVEDLSQNYDLLTEDTVVEKRDWQTDCYLDYQLRNKNPFLTGFPSDQPTRAKNEAAIRSVVSKEERKNRQIQDGSGGGRKKKVRMSSEAKNDGANKASSPERPHTARSITSNYSYKSDISEDGNQSQVTTDYDRLPAELRPMILHYRRESTTPKVKSKPPAPMTRMEKVQAQLREKEEQLMRVKRKSIAVSAFQHRPPSASPKKKGSRPVTAKPAVGADTPEEQEDTQTLGHHRGPKTTIAFSIETTSEGSASTPWLVHPSDTQDPESHTLRMWQRKLKELHRQREESWFIDKNRGANKPLVVKFYNDPQMRSLRAKHHQRSATVPSFFNKLPPSIASFSKHVANEALMIGEERVKTFVLTLPDGSGYCNYASGRQAVSLSRCDSTNGPLSGSRGLYILVFDDVEGSPLLGYFTPTGKACCYYQNGAIRMLSDLTGGRMYDEDGHTVREWVWPPAKLSMPETVSLHFNVHISLRCTSLTSMDLRVSIKGQGYKFPVGPQLEDLEGLKQNTDLMGGEILSSCPLISKAALSRTVHPTAVETELAIKRSHLTKRQRQRSISFYDDEDYSRANAPLPNLLAEGEKYSKQLTVFQEGVRKIVDTWMEHYCKTVGINIPAPPSISVSRTSLNYRGTSSRKRLVKSSMDYTSLSRPSCSANKLQRTRSLTHPLNSSRPSSRSISPLVPFNYLPAGGVEEAGAESPRALSPLVSMRPLSALDFVPPSSSPAPNELQNRPFKTGKFRTARPKGSGLHQPARGCPVALHKMLWNELDAMPPCKCDKRRVPFISDCEYDIFLLSHIPRNQLVVVCVISSLEEGSCSYEPMIDATYARRNRNRFSPCLQSSHDPFRLLKYDLAQISSGKNGPLLEERHNASTGMFLMYMNGKLVHGDYLFNGYSTTKRDFMKQIEACTQKGKKENFLPYNFKFSRRSGTKHVGSCTWACPVSGVMQDLISISPQSSSRPSSKSSHLGGSRIFSRNQLTNLGLSTTSIQREDGSMEGSEFTGQD